jgi:hypothetical protein
MAGTFMAAGISAKIWYQAFVHDCRKPRRTLGSGGDGAFGQRFIHWHHAHGTGLPAHRVTHRAPARGRVYRAKSGRKREPLERQVARGHLQGFQARSGGAQRVSGAGCRRSDWTHTCHNSGLLLLTCAAVFSSRFNGAALKLGAEIVPAFDRTNKEVIASMGPRSRERGNEMGEDISSTEMWYGRLREHQCRRTPKPLAGFAAKMLTLTTYPERTPSCASRLTHFSIDSPQQSALISRRAGRDLRLVFGTACGVAGWGRSVKCFQLGIDLTLPRDYQSDFVKAVHGR